MASFARISIAWVVLAMVSLAHASDLSGTYSSSFGELRLHQVGDYLIGDYADRGVMLGEISGDTVSGAFTNGTRAGQFTFTFDGRTFSGRWSFADGGSPGQWSGRRTGEAPDALRNFSVDGSRTRTLPNDRDVFDGRYGSNFGPVTLVQQDLFLIGDYGDRGILAGMWDGDGFVGRFTNRGRAGWFDFRFLSRDGSFRGGRWGWEVGEPEGSWTLTKAASSVIRPPMVAQRAETEGLLAAEQLAPPLVAFADRLEIDSRTETASRTGTANIVLPGETARTLVHYEVVDGLAIVDGDIILGPVSQLQDRYDVPAETSAQPPCTSSVCTIQQPLNVVSNLELLWPNGVIPYDFDSGVSTTVRNRINTAANNLTNQTNLRVVPRNGHSDYVRVYEPDDGCSAELGRQGGRQRLNLSSGCSVGNAMHEFLHAAGFTHEQQRKDRDQFVEIRWNKIEGGRDHNFKTKKGSTSLGAYDFGSMMHYPLDAFDEDDCTSDCDTIVPRVPVPAGVTVGQRRRLSATDIAGINYVYPAQVGFTNGLDWGQGFYPTAAATGDLDGDGNDELAIARRSSVNSRVLIYDYQNGAQTVIGQIGTDWGGSYFALDVAMGDIDGDGRDEIAVARFATENGRFFVFDDATRNFALMYTGGANWGSSAWATAVAFGDIDGDGRDELGVGRRSPVNGRYYVHNDAAAAQPFGLMAVGGADWGNTASTTDVAFGDVDADGEDEMGITRRHGSNARVFVDEIAGNGFTHVFTGGTNWGSGGWGQSIAFGNIDGDSAEEMLIGRRSSVNNRFFIHDDELNGFTLLEGGGAPWGEGYWTSGVDLDDFDGDGLDEPIVARDAGENSRVFLFDDRSANFQPLNLQPGIWAAGVGATDVAYGDLDGDGDQDIVITRSEQINGRPRFEVVISQ